MFPLDVCPLDVSITLHLTTSTTATSPSKLTLHLQKGHLILDQIRRQLLDADLPVYLEHSVLSTVQGVLKSQKRNHSRSIATNLPQKRRVNFLASAYESTTAKYDKGPLEDEFPKAYHRLVHSPVSSFFDLLLELETTNAQSVEELLLQRDDALVDLSARHARETELASDGGTNFTQLISRHVEEMEMAEATWASALGEITGSQRREYRELVLKLYAEQQNPLPRNETSQAVALSAAEDALPLSVKETTSLVVPDPQIPDGNSSTEISGNTGTPEPRQVTDTAEKEDPTRAKMIQDLSEMGFEKEQSACALTMTNGSMQEAIVLLLEQPEKVATIMRSQASNTPALRSSTPPQASTPPPSTGSGHRTPNNASQRQIRQAQQSNSARKQWSPISFLQQQRNAVLASQNVNSSVKKVSAWLGKAMENLGLDEGQSYRNIVQDDTEARFLESFTVSLGSQVRVTHNLRLLATDVHDLFKVSNDPARQMAIRAQTASALYSESLTGVVVVLTPKDWAKYRMGRTNKALFDRCARSAELHFEGLEKQIERIAADLEVGKDESQPVSLQEGDFFITRHSNLPLIHVVFHLVLDNEVNPKHELTARSSAFTGLRNILRIANRYDVTSMSLPLLLLPETAPDPFLETSASDASLFRRSELILKCVKGFLMESSRQSKRREGESHGEVKTLQFLLPRNTSESRFQGFRSTVANIFRAS